MVDGWWLMVDGYEYYPITGKQVEQSSDNTQ